VGFIEEEGRKEVDGVDDNDEDCDDMGTAPKVLVLLLLVKAKLLLVLFDERPPNAAKFDCGAAPFKLELVVDADGGGDVAPKPMYRLRAAGLDAGVSGGFKGSMPTFMLGAGLVNDD